MIFKTCMSYLDERIPITAPVGNPIYARKAARRTDNGLEIFVVEEVDTYAVIQSYKEGVDIKQLLQRYKESGDSSLLFRRAGQYANVAGAPLSLSEAFCAQERARQAYEKLDPSIRDHLSFDDCMRDPSNITRIEERIAQMAVDRARSMRDAETKKGSETE